MISRLTERRADTIYGLSEKSAEFRGYWKPVIAVGLFFGLGLISALISYNSFNTPLQKLTLALLSGAKYLPLLWVIYNTAQTKAAQYLNDIYELHDVEMAGKFIQEVAFGDGYSEYKDENGKLIQEGKITIHEGKISEKDEGSPVILIGGPGYIKVNLGSAALLEQIDGSSRVISASKEPWKLNRFERIREIGEFDEVGKREYATIDLQDQIVTNIKVKSRTKDGIPIEAHDIKIFFSILRDTESKDPYSFNRNAVADLVYKQTLITPKPDKNYGVSFPWEMTVIPLIKDEMEKLISSKALSEILSSISQKELDQLNENENSNTQMRVEITGQMTQTSSSNRLKLRTFETRSQITDRFFEDAFIKKAKLLGINLNWIDVGTWHLPSEMIQDNLKSAWQLARDNITEKNKIESSTKKLELERLLELVKTAIIEPFDRTPSSKYIEYSDTPSKRSRESDYYDNLLLMRYLEKAGSEVNKQSAKGFRLPDTKATQPKSASARAIEILKAIRREFIAALELIQREHISPLEKQQEIDRIHRAIEHIEYFIFRKIK